MSDDDQAPTAVRGDRGAVEPGVQLALSLLLSLALWLPSMLAALRGDLDVAAAGIRYLVAFLGCRVAVGGIASLLTTYRLQLDPAPVTAVGRRRDDPSAEPGVEVPDQVR